MSHFVAGGPDRANLYQEISDKIIPELEAGRCLKSILGARQPPPLGVPKNAATGSRRSVSAGMSGQIKDYHHRLCGLLCGALAPAKAISPAWNQPAQPTCSFTAVAVTTRLCRDTFLRAKGARPYGWSPLTGRDRLMAKVGPPLALRRRSRAPEPQLLPATRAGGRLPHARA